MSNFEYLLSPINKIRGVGKKTLSSFNKKKIFTIFDLLWHLPISKIETAEDTEINDLQVGKNYNIKVIPIKYNFPRIRNLPNKVLCEKNGVKLDCIFFNSYEGYIKKLLPLNEEIIIHGKANNFRNKFQFVNPTTKKINNLNLINEDNKYSLSDGLTLNKYNQIINSVFQNLPELDEWLPKEISSLFDNVSWKECIIKIHKEEITKIRDTKYFKRLVFDEIFANFLISSDVRNKIKKIKKKNKILDFKYQHKLISNLKFKLTADQINSLKNINKDMASKQKMFRLLQGDVGSGKTIVSVIAALNVIKAGYQVAIMAPTEILAIQHYKFILENFKTFCNPEILTGKTEYKKRKNILNDLLNNKIDILIGTHSLFQEKITYFNLGLIIIDEQHKFGVNQRKKLSDKGGKNCDVLVMSATPIPRTMMMTIYGDMDISLIKSKPKNRKPVKTYSKNETKINEVINFIKNEILKKNQVFWVCPLIKESKKIEHQSAIEKYKYLSKIFKDRVDIVHGAMSKEDKDKVLNKFNDKEIDILVSTTVIEVGIDFPNANVIVIENSNKYGLSQLHQLRGRVGRGIKESSCILMFKAGLSENARKRITILKNTNDGFKIAEEDLKIRGYGDILGFKQSGLKKYNLADPIQHEDLFDIAEKEIKKIEKKNIKINNFNKLIKLYDKVAVINETI
ncbi:ATP-dependent DNA helicase RecG [Candidatus Pelagibacter sp.]|nr:ATP-dependent DNA helicase RecG [Candidatus Pelagibacter sp.]